MAADLAATLWLLKNLILWSKVVRHHLAIAASRLTSVAADPATPEALYQKRLTSATAKRDPRPGGFRATDDMMSILVAADELGTPQRLASVWNAVLCGAAAPVRRKLLRLLRPRVG
jgi:hypothetical protein